MVFIIKPCIGCGYCCSMPCSMAHFKGMVVDNKCTALYWNELDERHWCGLVEGDPSLGFHIAIGAGCSSTMFNTWREELKDRT